MDWHFLSSKLGEVYSDGPGQPPLATRLMAGLHILKYADNLSDDEVCARWLENPYYQYFCGEEFFCHHLPLDRSSLTRWRQRMGEERLTALLQESLAVAVKTKAAKPADFTRVIVDTTVAEKDVAFPTDAKLIHKARERLVKQARRAGIKLRQSYTRVGKTALIAHRRYAHAKQYKRARRQLRKLKTYLRRTIGDIGRKIEGDETLPEFQRLFPDDAACAAYLEKARWGDGFACPHCGTAGEPFHFENRPGVLRCRKCRQNTGLTVGTVMERSHTPLNVWFWAAYLVASQTPGMSAVQFQRQLGLSRYETAFQILHKLRSGMVRPNQDRIGGQPKNHVEVDETWVGGRTRGEGRGVHHKVPVSCAIEVRHRKPGTKLDNRKDGRYAGRVRLAVVLDRSAESLCGFVESTVAPGSLIVTDDWSGYAGLGKRGYEHFAVAECGDPEVAEQYLPIIHLVFANLKTWLIGIHHGVSHQHLQAYLNEFTFRFNRRFYQCIPPRGHARHRPWAGDRVFVAS